jgi:hypothetical protein
MFEVDSVDYRIIPAKKLRESMTEIGYKQLRIYGDSKFTRFSDERSEDIIAVGAK